MIPTSLPIYRKPALPTRVCSCARRRDSGGCSFLPLPTGAPLPRPSGVLSPPSAAALVRATGAMAGLARTSPDSPAPVGLRRRPSSLSRGLGSSGATPPEEGRGEGGGPRGTSGPQRLAPSPPGRGHAQALGRGKGRSCGQSRGPTKREAISTRAAGPLPPLARGHRDRSRPFDLVGKKKKEREKCIKHLHDSKAQVL